RLSVEFVPLVWAVLGLELLPELEAHADHAGGHDGTHHYHRAALEGKALGPLGLRRELLRLVHDHHRAVIEGHSRCAAVGVAPAQYAPARRRAQPESDAPFAART